jgi:hypothetical protein
MGCLFLLRSDTTASTLSVRKGDPEGWSTVLITALGSWEKPVPRGHVLMRQGDPEGWSTVLITALGSWEKPVPRGYVLMRQGDPEGWSTVLITALGSWEKTAPRGYECYILLTMSSRHCCTSS